MSAQALTDERLIEESFLGSPMGFFSLVDRYERPLFHALERLTGNERLAEVFLPQVFQMIWI